MREILKSLLPGRIRFFLRAQNYKDLLLFSSFCCKRLWRFVASLPVSAPPRQSIPLSQCCIDEQEYPDGCELSDFLSSCNISFNQGRHCIYISDQAAIQNLAPDLIDRYPDNFALKIIKSREMSSDGTPYYTSRKNAPATNYVSMVAVGTVLEKVVISNILATYNYAPHVYDLIQIVINDVCHFALVVEHISGDCLTGEQGQGFIENFKKALQCQDIEIVAVKRNKDFQPPQFNLNIIGSTAGPKYIDIQNFALFSQKRLSCEWFVEKQCSSNIFADVTFSESRFPSLFTERKLNKQIGHFSQWCRKYLIRIGVAPSQITIFDAGSPIGVYTMCVLANEASWSYVFSEHRECLSVERSLFRNGFSRFTVIASIADDCKTRLTVDLLCFSYQVESELLFTILGVVDTQYLLIDVPVGDKWTIHKEKNLELKLKEIDFVRVKDSTAVYGKSKFISFKKP